MRHHGITLTEAIAAVVILGISTPPMLWGVRHAQTHRVSATQTSRARWLAGEKLEDVIADRHSGTRGYGYVAAVNYPNEAVIAGRPGFSRSVAISETGPDLVSPGAGYKRVTCSVSFLDGAGAARTVSLTTVLTDYSP